MNRHSGAFLASGIVALALLTAAPARADEKGEKLLKQAFKTLHASKAMTADFTMTVKSDDQDKPQTTKGTLAAMKPDYLKVVVKGTPAQSYVSDGKAYYMYREEGFTERAPQYVKNKLDENPTEFLGVWEGEIDAFFGGEKNADKVEASYVKSEKVNGVDCEVVAAKMKQQPRTITYSIGKKDNLIYRSAFEIGPGASQTNTLSNIKMSAKLTEEDFKFTPPKDAKELVQPEQPDFDSALVAVGRPAPKFNLATPTGGQVSLAQALKDKKAVLVNFWFYN